MLDMVKKKDKKLRISGIDFKTKTCLNDCFYHHTALNPYFAGKTPSPVFYDEVSAKFEIDDGDLYNKITKQYIIGTLSHYNAKRGLDGERFCFLEGKKKHVKIKSLIFSLENKVDVLPSQRILETDRHSLISDSENLPNRLLAEKTERCNRHMFVYVGNKLKFGNLVGNNLLLWGEFDSKEELEIYQKIYMDVCSTIGGLELPLRIAWRAFVEGGDWREHITVKDD